MKTNQQKSASDVLVMEIHNEVDTAEDLLLKEAEEIINSPKKIVITDKEKDIAQRLAKIGFVNSSGITKVKDKKQAILREDKKKADSVKQARLIKHYKETYPFCKFITEDMLNEICEKYNLIHAPIVNYIKEVPEKNLIEIETAQPLQESDFEQKTKYVLIGKNLEINQNMPTEIKNILKDGLDITDYIVPTYKKIATVEEMQKIKRSKPTTDYIEITIKNTSDKKEKAKLFDVLNQEYIARDEKQIKMSKSIEITCENGLPYKKLLSHVLNSPIPVYDWVFHSETEKQLNQIIFLTYQNITEGRFAKVPIRTASLRNIFDTEVDTMRMTYPVVIDRNFGIEIEMLPYSSLTITFIMPTGVDASNFGGIVKDDLNEGAVIERSKYLLDIINNNANIDFDTDDYFMDTDTPNNQKYRGQFIQRFHLQQQNFNNNANSIFNKDVFLSYLHAKSLITEETFSELLNNDFAFQRDTIAEINAINTEGLFIVAPESHFNLDDIERNSKFGYFESKKIEKVVPKDPIVYRYVKGGVQILTKWGLEANDENLANEILN